MNKEERLLRDYFKQKISRVEKKSRPAFQSKRIGQKIDADRKNGGVWVDVIGFAALLVCVLGPHVIQLPLPPLAEKSSDVYERYIRNPTVVTKNLKAIGASIEDHFKGNNGN